MPSVVQAKTSTDASNDATQSFDLFDSAPTSGNTIILLSALDGGPTVSVAPTGFTELGRRAFATNVTQIAFYKEAAGTETGSSSWTASGSERSVHRIWEISGAVDPTVTTPSYSAGASADNTNADPDGLTGLDSADWLGIAWVGLDTGDETVSAYPSGYSGTGFQGVSGSGGVTAAWGVKEFTGTSEDPGQFTNSSEQWIAALVAVKGSGASQSALPLLMSYYG